MSISVAIFEETAVNKHPTSELDYKFDWEAWLDGDTIASSVWVVPPGVAVESEANTTTTATVFVSGGVKDQIFRITNTIVTAGGRTETAALKLVVTTKGGAQ